MVIECSMKINDMNISCSSLIITITGHTSLEKEKNSVLTSYLLAQIRHVDVIVNF